MDELQNTIREVGSNMCQQVLDRMENPGGTPYRASIASFANAVQDQVTAFVDDLTETVRDEVTEFTRAAWEIRKSK